MRKASLTKEDIISRSELCGWCDLHGTYHPYDALEWAKYDSYTDSLERFCRPYESSAKLIIDRVGSGFVRTLSGRRPLEDGIYRIDRHGENIEWGEIINPAYLVDQLPLLDGQQVAPMDAKQKKKGEKNMMDNIFKTNMGKIEGDQFKLSVMGVAVLTGDGEYAVYNGTQMVSIGDMVLDIDKGLYKMPVTEVSKGDLIVDSGKPYFVRVVNDDGSVEALDPIANKVDTLLPALNMLNINFFTKVVSLFDGSGSFGSDEKKGEGVTSSPFGNINPMMLMMMSDGDEDSGGLMEMMMMSSMMGGSNKDMNPMLMMSIMSGGKKGKSNKMLEMMMMSSMMGNTNPFSGFLQKPQASNNDISPSSDGANLPE